MLNSAYSEKGRIINGYVSSGELKKNMSYQIKSFEHDCEQKAVEKARNQLKDMDESELRYLVVNKDKLSPAQKNFWRMR